MCKNLNNTEAYNPTKRFFQRLEKDMVACHHQMETLVRQDKSGASSGCNSRPGKGEARPPGIESWAHGGNNMG